MKRWMSAVLAIVLMFSLCSCSVENTNSAEKKVAPSVNEKNESNNESSEHEDIQKDASEHETVLEQVLLDESGLKISAKQLEKDGLFGADLKVMIENNTDKNLTVQVRSASVNGYMVETIFSPEIASGKKANDEITFMSSDLEACGIEIIADMEFSFHVFDDDWDTFLDSDMVKVKTSAHDSYIYEFDDSGDELYSGSGLRIVSKGFSEDESIFGPGLVLFIINEGDKPVTVQARDVSVNGFMVDTIFSEDVYTGKHALSAITILSTSLEENGIEEIEEMELSFHIFESSGWETIEDTDVIIVKS